MTSLSLGVLVNLCYKNLPAVYTLMRSVDSKEFLRTILKLQNDSIDTRVQVLFLYVVCGVFVTYMHDKFLYVHSTCLSCIGHKLAVISKLNIQ